MYFPFFAAVIFAGLYHVRHQRTVRAAVLAVVATGAFGMMLAIPLGQSTFDIMRLVAWGWFVGIPVTLAGCAVLLWRGRRRWAMALTVALLAIVGIAIDAFFIEPHWLEVTHYRLTSSKLKTPLKIAVIADLQTDEIGDYERDVLQRVKAEQPDLILWAGDYIQHADPAACDALRGKLNILLRELNLAPPLGAFAIEGDADRGNWPSVFAATSTRPLATEAPREAIDLPRTDVSLTGLNLSESRYLKSPLEPSHRFHICLGHSPDFALVETNADLLVAGHTHGGQVRIPFFGPPITLSRVPRAWAAGLTEFSPGRHLVVSRGIGMERDDAPRLRFNCRPQLVFIQLTPNP